MLTLCLWWNCTEDLLEQVKGKTLFCVRTALIALHRLFKNLIFNAVYWCSCVISFGKDLCNASSKIHSQVRHQLDILSTAVGAHVSWIAMNNLQCYTHQMSCRKMRLCHWFWWKEISVLCSAADAGFVLRITLVHLYFKTIHSLSLRSIYDMLIIKQRLMLVKRLPVWANTAFKSIHTLSSSVGMAKDLV